MKLYEVLVDNVYYYPDNECVSILVVATNNNDAINKAFQNIAFKFYDKEKCEFTATEINELEGYKIKLELIDENKTKSENDLLIEDLW